MNWKKEITKQLKQATEQGKIHKELKKLAKLLLDGDTRFILVYLNGRGQFIAVSFREPMTKKTGALLLRKGYKNFYLQNR